MIPPRPPRAIDQAALHIVAACALAAALTFLIAPIWAHYYWMWLVIGAVFRLSLPLSFLWMLRWLSPVPGDVESGAVRLCAWTSIFVVFDGLMYISWFKDSDVSIVYAGLKDVPWFCLLVASESARLAVMRGSVRPRVIAIGAFALAIGSSLALGPGVKGVILPESFPRSAFESVHACIAPHPWIAMICLAGLWLWVGLADRRRAVPASVPE